MSHYRTLLSLNNSNIVNYYINISIKQNLSVRQLREKIKNKEYERLDEETRKNSNSTLDEDLVVMYLTKVDGINEEEVLLDKYSNLTQTEKTTNYTEKVLYTGVVDTTDTIMSISPTPCVQLLT